MEETGGRGKLLTKSTQKALRIAMAMVLGT